MLLAFFVVTIVYLISLYSQNVSLNAELGEMRIELADINEELSTIDQLLAEHEEMGLEFVNISEELSSASKELLVANQLLAELENQEQTIDSLQQNLYSLSNPTRSTNRDSQYIRLNDGRYLRYSRPDDRGRVDYIHILEQLEKDAPYTLVVDTQYPQSSEQHLWDDLSESSSVISVSEPSVSPCTNFLTFVPIWERSYNPLIIYDMRTDESQSIELFAHEDTYNTQTAPRHAAWLDEQLLLVLIKHQHGTPLRGGELYAYDIYNQTLTLLDVPVPEGSQIFSLQLAGDVVYMDLLMNFHNAMFFNITPHSISFSEIYPLISEGETRDVAE